MTTSDLWEGKARTTKACARDFFLAPCVVVGSLRRDDVFLADLRPRPIGPGFRTAR